MTRPRSKAVVLIIDGLGDLPVAALDGRTPLEAARTPNLDWLAAAGEFGLVDPIVPGEVPNTDSGVGLLLGLAPEQHALMRRGPVEAAGAGRALREGEIAVRANFATLQETADGLVVTDRRAGRITAGTAELAAVLNGLGLGAGLRAEFRPTDQHRGVLILSGQGLDPCVSDTDPGDCDGPCLLQRCEARRPDAARTANAINEFVQLAHRALRGHTVNLRREAAGQPPANGIITRGAGAWFRPDNVLLELGLRVAVVAGCNTVLGLARLFDFDAVIEPGFTADLDTDLEGKVAAALRALASHDIAFVHVKGPDLCAHDRLPLAKRDFLERLDHALTPLLAARVSVALTSDHTTDSNSGWHTADPVPSLIFDPSRQRPVADPAPSFGEQACRDGNLPRLRSHQFLRRLLAAGAG
jgi:2,3-bisphosphoglycerate-independent phosphoglycerate mutase